MSKFVKKALDKLPKLEPNQIKNLLGEVVKENELFEMVLGSMTHGVVVTDESHRILFCNRPSHVIMNKRPHEGTLLWEAVSDSDISQLLRESLEKQLNFEDHEMSLDFRGSFRIYSMALLPLVQKGKIRGSLFQIEDITDKKNREARFRRAENLASLTTLAAGVAHEIKNPLGSIGIHLQLIQKSFKNQNCGDFDYPRIEKFLDVIAEEVERLNGIVVDFLFAVRPMDTSMLKGDLNKVVVDLLDFLHFEMDQSDVQMVTNLDEKLPQIDMDERFIKQAILNIVKNAIHAMEGGGTLKVRTYSKENEVHLEIQDTGIGIPKDIRDKIFEPYFTTKDSGSGLGLTLVYKIIKEHGGEIQVDSDEGVGTKFCFTFPIPQKEKHLIMWEGVEP
ncbi:two-component system sensor histidine kinase NtrB [Spirochaeta cellobiosiphila]|uniref:two-component system sensor histidine kinase NtrB n=1 Tax=Spirochaeta cellobiosiphila TaxID=504483 RepID=UPI000425BC87|nr:ATP-binding protein [Spirochaeta cellobiosiphila]